MSSALPSMTVDEIFHDRKRDLEAQQDELAAAFDRRAPGFLADLDRLKTLAPGFKTILRGQITADTVDAHIITNIPLLHGPIPAEPTESSCFIIHLTPKFKHIHPNLGVKSSLQLRRHTEGYTTEFTGETMVAKTISYLCDLIHDRGMATSPSAGGGHPKQDPADTNQPVCR